MPIKVKIYNNKAEEVGNTELPNGVFGLKPNSALMHQALVAQISNSRQNLAHTKDRSEVRGGGRKPWRQKGTGRARAGSSRSPIWIGGGVTFGPRNERNFSKKINAKMKKKAICMAFSDKLANNNLFVLEGIQAEKFETKKMDTMLKQYEKKLFQKEKTKDGKLKKARSVLIISDNNDEKVRYSLRNLKGAKSAYVDNVNIVDLLSYKNLIVTAGSADIISKRYKQADPAPKKK